MPNKSACFCFCDCKLSCSESISNRRLRVILEAASAIDVAAVVASLLAGFCSSDRVRRICEDTSVRLETWLLAVFINFYVRLILVFYFGVVVTQFSVSALKLAPSGCEKSKLRMPRMFLVFCFEEGTVRVTLLV